MKTHNFFKFQPNCKPRTCKLKKITFVLLLTYKIEYIYHYCSTMTIENKRKSKNNDNKEKF